MRSTNVGVWSILFTGQQISIIPGNNCQTYKSSLYFILRVMGTSVLRTLSVMRKSVLRTFVNESKNSMFILNSIIF
jgi:hypothetical protein